MARRLLPLLRAGMLVLPDRAFDADAFLGEVAATGALLLARAKSSRRPPVLGHLPDGSYLSQLDGLAVRVIEASVTVNRAGSSRPGLVHPHRLRHLRTQYAASRHTLDNPAQPLTSWL